MSDILSSATPWGPCSGISLSQPAGQSTEMGKITCGENGRQDKAKNEQQIRRSDQADKFLFFPHRLYTHRSRKEGEDGVALSLGNAPVPRNRILTG